MPRDLFESNQNHPHEGSVPLAERMRPVTIGEFVGQEHLIGPGKPLRRVIENGLRSSLIFWGPAGSGKTSLARLLARNTRAHFVEFSAVLSGIKQIKDVIKTAEYLKSQKSLPTILFIDEIHRFNKAQQDAFLPCVENGTILLLGATTENPSFEVISALLSRSRVFTLKPLSKENIISLIQRVILDPRSGMADGSLQIDPDVPIMLAELSGGDARVALSTLEFAWGLASEDDRGIRTITGERIAEALEKKPVQYDRSGEHHFNMISAFHKSLRGSDPQAALYWLARMLDGGEDPLYICRRMVRFASEDIGLADPRALTISIAARDAYHFLGSPEGDLALAECAIYLATAPKSNRSDRAFQRALESARNTSDLPVPLAIRNAPTRMMQSMGYGNGYRYDHDAPDGYAGQEFLPSQLSGTVYYEPGNMGFEMEISRRLDWWLKRRQELRSEGESSAGNKPKNNS